MGGNRIDLLIFLLIVGISLANWIIAQVKERREIKKINERRRAEREGSLAPADESDRDEQSIAEARKERLRQLRREQAERVREQVRVMTGQGAGGQQGGTATAPGPVMGPRRPTRPGRTARRPGQAGQPGQRPTAPSSQRPARPAAQQTTPSVDVRRDRRPISEPAPPMARPERRSVFDASAIGSGQASLAASETPPVRIDGQRVDWRQAIVLSEVLARPVGERDDHLL
jgi:hypothetical protein